jgi:hypothetical protein
MLLLAFYFNIAASDFRCRDCLFTMLQPVSLGVDIFFECCSK